MPRPPCRERRRRRCHVRELRRPSAASSPNGPMGHPSPVTTPSCPSTRRHGPGDERPRRPSSADRPIPASHCRSGFRRTAAETCCGPTTAATWTRSRPTSPPNSASGAPPPPWPRRVREAWCSRGHVDRDPATEDGRCFCLIRPLAGQTVRRLWIASPRQGAS